MPLPTSPRTSSNCTKQPGEPCRLHNPSPLYGFKSPGETRVLGLNVPYYLADHVKASKQAGERFSVDERTVLMRYPHNGWDLSELLRLGSDGLSYDSSQPSWREVNRDLEAFSSRQELVSFMETLDSALSSRADEKRVVYRGTHLSALREQVEREYGVLIDNSDREMMADALKKFYHKGRVFQFDWYLSTSASPQLGADWAQRRESNPAVKRGPFSGVVFEMSTNSGVDITGLVDGFAHEREVLLPRETFFRVVNVEVAPREYKTEAGIEVQHVLGAELQKKGTYHDLGAVVQLVEVDKHGRELTTHEPHVPFRSVESIVPRVPEPSAELWYKNWLNRFRR